MTEPQSARRRLSTVQIVLILAVVAVGIFWFVHWLVHDRVRIATDDATIDTDQVMIMSRIAERVDRVLVDVNTPVRAGQTLVLLDDAQERARLALAESNVQSLEAQADAARRAAELERQLQSAQVRGGDGRIEAARQMADAAGDSEVAESRALAVATQNVASAREAVRAAQAAVPAAEAADRRADADERRSEALAAQGYVSSSALEAARESVAQAHAALDVARSAAASAGLAVEAAAAKVEQERANGNASRAARFAAQSQVGIATASLEGDAAASRVPAKASLASSAAAQVSVMKAQAELARLDLDATRIVASVDGWVSQRNVEVGQTVSPGQALVTISPRNRIFVTANYKETQVARIHVGQDVEITIDACRGTYHGVVTAIAPVSQSALSTLPTLTAPSTFVKVAQRVPVRISLPKPDGSCVFRPGVSVETAILSP